MTRRPRARPIPPDCSYGPTRIIRPVPLDREAFTETLQSARRALLAARTPAGQWEGDIPGGAFATAAAVFALHQYRLACNDDAAVRATDAQSSKLVRQGLGWLALNQNADGGWGETVESGSDVGSTALCWAAFTADSTTATGYSSAVAAAEAWLARAAGNLEPERLARAIADRYGTDPTLSVPILALCAVAGRLGPPPRAWRLVPQLPFERAVLPGLNGNRLPVAHHALPAFLAVGLVRHVHLPTKNPVARAARAAARGRALRRIEQSPAGTAGASGAAPLTGFVVASLCAAGHVDSPAVRQGTDLLLRAARDDGSWPVETNLATRVTTLAVNALLTTGSESAHTPKPPRGSTERTESPAAPPRDPPPDLSGADSAQIRDWLLRQHPTDVPGTPAGWAQSDVPGSVPDADDTAGALLALKHLGGRIERANPIDPTASDGADTAAGLRALRRHFDADEPTRAAAAAGVRWLLDRQGADGGIPVDPSGSDLTAHALRAWRAWGPELPPDLQARVREASLAAVRYLVAQQRPGGSWLPLWFGSQRHPNGENPTYGTARVLRAAFSVPLRDALPLNWTAAVRKGVEWLLSAQNTDGGWGGGAGIPPSVEETALAAESLANVLSHDRTVRSGIDTERDDEWTIFHKMDEVVLDGEGESERVTAAVERAATWLVERTRRGREFPPAPIGRTAAGLWYVERLYPLAFTVAALEQVRAALGIQFAPDEHRP